MTRAPADATTANGKPRTDRAALLLVLATATGWLLLRLGDTALGVPFDSAQGLGTWLDEVDPAVLATAVLRLVALALCGYLVAVTALGLLTTLAGWRSAAAAASRLMPRTLRRVVVGGTGLGLTGTMLSPAFVSAATDDPDPDRTAVMIKLEPDGAAGSGTRPEASPSTSTTSTTTTTSTTSTTSTTTTTSTAASPTPQAPTSSTSPGQPPAPPPDRPVAGTAAAGDTRDTDSWIVRTGDSFWSIAEEIVAEDFEADDGSAPSDADIARYWRELIAANRDRLAEGDNPDLLLPNQELRLP